MMTMFCFATSTNATLWERGSDLVYDDDFNITWYDFTYSSTGWNDAITWADDLVYKGYDDWRLPTALNPDGSGPDTPFYNAGSEMGHLYYVEFGNAAGAGPHQYGPFNNIQPSWYWSSTELGSDYAWYFQFGNGWQNDDPKWATHCALAVRDGDVATIDILPGDDNNIINPRRMKKISVAILSTPGFSASTIVDQPSLTFGVTGDEASWFSCTRKPKDVNGDGTKDLVCQFSTRDAGFQCGDVVGILKGTALSGERSFEGRQTVLITPCK